MIGSPDLLAFTGTEGFGDGGKDPDPQAPPEELLAPLLTPSHPWTTSAQFHRDFVLVAEFSEQVGPKPVLTIPDDPRVIGSFDLNHFSVRIMSVDYQASGPPHAPSASSGLHLNFSEDSEVILGDSGDDAFAYVHHVTLYDLQARGMVRPFCMAYVCSDQVKLMENFVELSTGFSQASDSLKTGNRQAFSVELQRKLQELEYRRLSLLQEGEHARMENGFTPVGENEDELEAVESSILNHRELLRQVTAYPNRKMKQPNFLPYDPAGFIPDPNALVPPEPCQPLSSSTSCRSQRRLKPLQELCNSYFLSLMKEQLANTERRLRGDRSVLRSARITHSLSRKLTLVNFLFEQWSPEDEDEEERESAEAEPQGETETKSGGDAFQFDPKSLESFWSCVEGIPIKLEAGGTWTGTPDPNVAMEMTGSVSSSDSIEVLGTEKSYRTQEEASAGATDWRAAGDASARRVRAYARRTNSEDSIEVLSTTESIIPEDLTAIEEEEAEHQPLSNGFENDDEIPAPEKEDMMTSETTLVNQGDNGRPARGEDGRLGTHESLKATPINGDVSNQAGVGERLKRRQVREEKPGKMSKLLQDLHVSFTPPVTLAEEDRWPPPCPPLRLLTVDEASDCTSLTSSLLPPSPTQSIHSSPCSAKKRRRRRRKAALRALRFLKQNSFSQHAVFCLLSGQPLVVVGGDERSVQKLVDALSLFLPAADGNAVMVSLTRPLLVSDLLTWRLIGIHRSPSSSMTSILHSLTRYSRYLALLNLDQRTLRCPSYSGSLVGRLADPHTGISRGITYLLHLESCLTALANQALLYTFCPAVQHPKATGGKEGPEEEEDSLLSRGFCSSETDLRVMHFLSDLIKQRHAGRGPPVLRFSYCSMQLHRNTSNINNG